MDQFADLSRAARPTAFVYHEDLGVGNGLSDGGRTAVQLLRRQVGRTERLGQAIHQKDLGGRKSTAQHGEHALRHRSTRVRDVAQVGEPMLEQGRVGLDQHTP